MRDEMFRYNAAAASFCPMEFVVEGHFTFPLDMLRYDSCWPADGNAVGHIAETFESELRVEKRRTGRPWRICLRSAATRLTPDRWLSFGWSIVPEQEL